MLRGTCLLLDLLSFPLSIDTAHDIIQMMERLMQCCFVC